jgi:hypothetical protein
MEDLPNKASSKLEGCVPHDNGELEGSSGTNSSSLHRCPNRWTEEEWTRFQQIDNFDVSQDEVFHQGLEHIIESLMYPTMNRVPMNLKTIVNEEISITNSTFVPSSFDHLSLSGQEFERELCRAKAVYVTKFLGFDIDFSRYLDYREFLAKQSLLDDRDILSSRCPYLNQLSGTFPFPTNTKYEKSEDSDTTIHTSCPFLNSLTTDKQQLSSTAPIESSNREALETPSNDC